MKIMNLTTMEVKFLNAMRDNEYGDVYNDDEIWTSTVIENSGLTPTQAGGVITSLKTKCYIYQRREGKDSIVALTKGGKRLFERFAGIEECRWGGPNLLDIGLAKEIGEQAQLRAKIIAILEEEGIIFEDIQIRKKRIRMIVGDRTVKGELALHAKIKFFNEDVELVMGGHNVFDRLIFTDKAVNKLIDLGF